MSTATASKLTITYTGEPLSVEPSRITPKMFVPSVTGPGELDLECCAGRDGAQLFALAQTEGALLIPEGIVVECDGEDDEDGSGIVLEVYAAEDRRVGVTCGWSDAGHLARRSGDQRAENDPGVVEEALKFLAAQVNTALGVNPL